MATIRELVVRLGVEADTKALEKFEGGLELVKQGMKQVVVVGAAVVGTIAAVAYTTALAGDQAAKGAQRTATQTEEYQRLAYAAGTAGVSIEQLEAALKLSNKVLQDVQKGTKATVEKLNALGLDIDGTETQAELMYEVADAIAATEDPQQRLAIATAVYGEEVGARMVPLLSQGADGMRALGLEAEALGMVMGEGLAKESEAFLDNLGRVQGIAAGLRNELGAEFIPVLNEMLGAFIEFYKEHQPEFAAALRDIGAVVGTVMAAVGRFAMFLVDAAEQTIGIERALKLAAVAAAALAWALVGSGLLLSLAGLVTMVSTLGPALAGMASAAGTVAGLLAGVAPYVAAVAAGMASLLLYFWPVIAAFTAFGVVLDDLLTLVKGGNSAIGTFIERNREAGGVLGALAGAADQVVRIFQALYTIAGAAGDIIAERIGDKASGAAEKLRSALEPVRAFLADRLAPVAEAVLGFIEDKLKGITEFLAPITEALEAEAGVASTAQGAVGAADAALGADAAGAGALAPDAATTGYAPLPGAPAAAAAGAGGPTTINTGGNSWVLNGIGSHEEVREIIREEVERSNRDAASALAAGER